MIWRGICRAGERWDFEWENNEENGRRGWWNGYDGGQKRGQTADTKSVLEKNRGDDMGLKENKLWRKNLFPVE